VTKQKIRVLVVDDSVVVRRLLCDAIAGDPELEVAGTAENGVRALERIDALNPDLVTLDVEMPEMDGLETLSAVRKKFPRLPVIMFSTLTHRGTSATIEALTRGASDYVTKPSNVGSITEGRQTIRDQLVPKIKSLCPRFGLRPPTADLSPSGSHILAPPPQPALLPPRAVQPLSGLRPAAVVAAAAARPAPARTPRRIDAVVIGVSTGGPNALVRMLPALPAQLPVPVLIVQHMPPVFTALLAERLAKLTPFPVREAAGGERLGPRQGWVAPGGHHLAVAAEFPGWGLRLQSGAPENSCRPAADVLFRSAAAAFGPGVLAVVMTGMGQDGQAGCEAVRAAGGQVIVQDEATSVVWGMPGSVVRAGLADRVLPLDQIAGEIARRVSVGRDVLLG
jgi:two-component system chemotaxis response regulator CheB